MTVREFSAFALVASLLWVAGCTGSGANRTIDLPQAARTIQNHIIYSHTNWSGDVHLDRPLVVTRTGTLFLQPGTRVFFDVPEPKPKEDREPWILVAGGLVALGTPEAPILFSSLQLRHNELDDMIHVREAKEAHFRHCVFERGPWALHVHETPVDVTSSVFRNNYGGVRFQGDRVVLRGSRFEENRIGVRSLRASPVIEECSFVGNLTGIFFREGISRAVVQSNNFDNREYDIKLGEGQGTNVMASRNWWQAAEAGNLAERIYDGADSEGIGLVIVGDTLAAPWGAEGRGR